MSAYSISQHLLCAEASLVRIWACVCVCVSMRLCVCPSVCVCVCVTAGRLGLSATLLTLLTCYGIEEIQV